MEEIVKVAFLGIAGVLIATQFKGTKSEYSVYIGLAISILIFAFCMRRVEAITVQFFKLQNLLNGSEEYLSILLRVIGITYICEFSANICKDAGYQSIAGQIEVLGKLSVMFAGIPILFAVINQIQSFM